MSKEILGLKVRFQHALLTASPVKQFLRYSAESVGSTSELHPTEHNHQHLNYCADLHVTLDLAFMRKSDLNTTTSCHLSKHRVVSQPSATLMAPV